MFYVNQEDTRSVMFDFRGRQTENVFKNKLRQNLQEGAFSRYQQNSPVLS